ncbi:MAG: SH3 domain-containing protein [Pleurocapsa minor GSE-CHR-MK-17-07R]|nr:SH3 domain-containing protein [Pleurocapsa minor GSE-CHR-MK 17-07R]
MNHRHPRRLLAITLMLILSLFAGIFAVSADESFTVTAIGTVNVRSGPGTGYSIIGRLFNNQSVTANGRESTSNDWLRVDYEGSEGWVSASYVVLAGDPTTLTIVEAASAETFVGNTGVTVTLEDSTNIRVGPGTNYPVIAAGQSGDQFDITGRSAYDARIVCFGNQLNDLLTEEAPEDVWLEVNFNGFPGWVNYAVVTVSGDLCSVEEADASMPEDALANELFGRVLVTTLENVNLRASNFTSAEVIGVIPFNTTLTAEARDASGNRVRVTWQGETGWISTVYIEVSSGNLDNLTEAQE